MLKMRGRRSFVVREKAETVKSSILEIIEFNPDQSQFARIHATDHPDLFPGDRVIIGKYSGAPFTIDGVEGFIVTEDDVLAIIE